MSREAFHRLVVDTSVAVKWFFDEPESSAAVNLLEEARAGRLALVVPDLVYPEFGNAVRKRVVRDGLAPEDGAVVVAAFTRVAFHAVLPTRLLVPAAYRLALESGATVYDAIFLAAAGRAKAALVTADERLYRAASDGAVGVRRLGGDS